MSERRRLAIGTVATVGVEIEVPLSLPDTCIFSVEIGDKWSVTANAQVSDWCPGRWPLHALFTRMEAVRVRHVHRP